MKIKEEEDKKRKELAAKERQRKIEKGLISEDDPDEEEEGFFYCLIYANLCKFIRSCDTCDITITFCIKFNIYKRINWLVWSPGRASPVDIRSAPTLSTFKNIISHVLTSLTNCFAGYEQRTLYGAFVLTLAMLLRLINCRLIIIIYYYSLLNTNKRES